MARRRSARSGPGDGVPRAVSRGRGSAGSTTQLGGAIADDPRRTRKPSSTRAGLRLDCDRPVAHEETRRARRRVSSARPSALDKRSMTSSGRATATLARWRDPARERVGPAGADAARARSSAPSSGTAIRWRTGRTRPSAGTRRAPRRRSRAAAAGGAERGVSEPRARAPRLVLPAPALRQRARRHRRAKGVGRSPSRGQMAERRGGDGRSFGIARHTSVAQLVVQEVAIRRALGGRRRGAARRAENVMKWKVPRSACHRRAQRGPERAAAARASVCAVR